MKILLLGEYSHVHWTLAEGLRHLGHQVTVASNGDFWKNYPRDIDLNRKAGICGFINFTARLIKALPSMRGYDVVQLINPMFLELKAERIQHIYRYLRQNNGKLVLGAFGMDYYWVHECCTRKPLRYSDFNFGNELRQNPEALTERRDWVGTVKQRLNELIASEADAIVAGLYEYWVCYQPLFPAKTHFIPFPIQTPHKEPINLWHPGQPLKLFIGINRTRSSYKGTDVMLQAAQRVAARHPANVELRIAESIPFAQYRVLMEGSDAILDQLYSYTPAMNALEAMSKGIICIGGGEPENYQILGEEELRPIINVDPKMESVEAALETLATHPERINQLKQQSIDYILRHHDYLKVARQYEQLYCL